MTYDGVGNPLTIGAASLTWRGRQLTNYALSPTKNVSYTYNADGIRTSKTFVDGSTTTRHEYTLSGSQIVKETVYTGSTESYTLVYLYDEYGSPIGFRYRTPSYSAGVFDGYFFKKNIQGDIVGIWNQNGTKVVSYVYDAWGNVTVSGTGASGIGAKNPFRYRGYYYDTEMGFYYVSSRYYDPEIGRWINADSQLNTSLGILGLNQFSYCLNNPVNMVDYGGNKPGDLFDTMDEAARDFAEFINEKSISVDCEYGSFIYKKTVWVTQTITYYNPNIFGNNFLSKLWNYIFRGGLTKTITKRVKVAKYSYVEPKKRNCT